MSEAELNNFATEQLKHQSQSSGQMRQNAMNAAAGISNPQQPPAANNAPAYNHNQSAYQANGALGNGTNGYTGNAEQGTPIQQQQLPQQQPQQQHVQQQQQQQQVAPQQNANMAAGGTAANNQHNYAQLMRQRQMQQMRLQQPPQQQQQSPQAQAQHQSPSTPHAQLSNGGSPHVAHASPHATAASPHVTSANASPSMHMAQPSQVAGQARPPSRSHTPQQPPMQRLGSSGGVPGVGMQSGGVQSPGSVVVHGSPRPQQTQQQQAGVAR
jgi:chromatin modification-related protein VID21